MIKVENITSNILRITVPEILKAEDFKNVELQFHEYIKLYEKVRLLVDASKFNGWENMTAFENHAGFVNLRNVEDKDDALPSPIIASGTSIGNGKFSLDGRLNILKPTPDMDLNIKLENAQLPSINQFSEAYALIDFTKGNLSVYSEIAVKDNKLSGYVKPIAQDISVLDLKSVSNPVKLAWESVVSVFIEIFKNHPKDQLATKVPLEGDLSNIKTSRWAAIAGILRNAFIKSFSKGIDKDINFNKLNSQQ